MTKYFRNSYVKVLCLLLFCSGLHAADIMVVTESWPPYNYMEGETVKGFSTEVARETLKRAGIKAKIRLMEWKSAYHLAETQPNTLIFTMARTEKREKKFKWIGPLAPRRVNLYKLKKHHRIQIGSLEDIKKYRISITAQDAMQHYLISLGLEVGKQIYSVRRQELGVRMLFADRVDLITGNDLTLAMLLNQEGYRFSELQHVYDLIDKGAYYMAFNPDTPDELVARVRASFKSVVNDGLLETIRKRYMQ